jgi:hypothetical protein
MTIVFGNGVCRVVQIHNNGGRSPLTTVSIAYSAGTGSVVIEDVRGIFKANITSADIRDVGLYADAVTGLLSNGSVSITKLNNKFAPDIPGTYTDFATGTTQNAYAYIGMSTLNTSFNYYDFSYVSGTTATAIQNTYTDEKRVTVSVDLASGTSYDSVTGIVTGRIWGSHGVVSSMMNFFNESTNASGAQGMYSGVLDIRP